MAWTVGTRGEWLRVIATIIIVGTATVVRIAFLSELGPGHPFLTFYPAVVIASLYGGLYCGFLAAALSTLGAVYLIMEPAGHLIAEDRLGLLVFIFEGLTVSCIAGVMRRAQARAKEAEAHARIAQERQRFAETLGESEERLGLALESGLMGMWEWDLQTDYSVWNDMEYELLGLPRGDGRVATEEFFKRVHPDDAAALKQVLAEVMGGETAYDYEFRIIRPDGQVRWLAGKGRLYRDAAGRPLRMTGVNFDITADKMAEEELQRREAEARARANELAVLMDTVPAVTFIAHDPACQHMSCSRQTRQLLRVPEKANVSMSAPEGERPAAFRPMKDGKELTPEELPVQIAATGREVRNFEVTLLFNDGTSRDLLGDAVPLFDESGTVRGAIGAFLDVTELNRVERELQKAHDELEKRVEERTAELQDALESLKKETEERMQTLDALRERDQMLVHQSRLAAMGEMINNIAHQWRQPLNVLGLIVQELQVIYRKGEFNEDYLKAQMSKSMELIFHMSQTIEDFRNFFRPSVQKMAFKAEEMIGKTLALVVDTLKNSEITVQVEEIGEPVIYGYVSECSQVLLNLLLNARDAFLEQKKEKARVIRVRTFCEDGKTVLTIADNAGGIPEEIIEKIFEPYFTTRSPDKGTGIGLFMAKNIIEKHMNGRFTVRNVEGGAEFRIEVESTVPPPSE